MSDRADRSRANGTKLLLDAVRDARAALDAAIPDQLLAIVGPRDGSTCATAIANVAERAVEALDADDLRLIVFQEQRLLGSPADGGWKWRKRRNEVTVESTVEDVLRGTVERIIVFDLGQRLARRAQQFTAADEAFTATDEAA